MKILRLKRLVGFTPLVFSPGCPPESEFHRCCILTCARSSRTTIRVERSPKRLIRTPLTDDIRWTRLSMSGSRQCSKDKFSPGVVIAWIWRTRWKPDHLSSITTLLSMPPGFRRQCEYRANREVRVARSHEGAAARITLQAREICIHGTTGTYRQSQVGSNETAGRRLP